MKVDSTPCLPSSPHSLPSSFPLSTSHLLGVQCRNGAQPLDHSGVRSILCLCTAAGVLTFRSGRRSDFEGWCGPGSVYLYFLRQPSVARWTAVEEGDEGWSAQTRWTSVVRMRGSGLQSDHRVMVSTRRSFYLCSICGVQCAVCGVWCVVCGRCGVWCVRLQCVHEYR